MKKITFILIALISGSAFSQASDVATVKAEIVSPIGIESEGELNFGKLQNIPGGGSVTVSPGSTTAEYSDDKLKVTGGAISYPTFNVTAASAYQIILPETASLKTSAEGGNNTMTLKDFTTNLNSISGVTAEKFWLGATLEIGNDQLAGNYDGEVKVTVSYE